MDVYPMAASGSSSSTSITATVPAGFHYETKFIVLNYLGLLSTRRSTAVQGDSQNERERNMEIKAQIEEELRLLEDEISAPSAGFSRHTSVVFSPINPESSIEDSLAALGDQVARELDTHLGGAVHTLLTGPLDYQSFRETILDLSAHIQGGWSKVLLPLVLLQALQSEGQSPTHLVPLGVRFLEESDADYIIQQGGWGAIFGLVAEEEQAVTIAEDSNDIYILSGEQHPDQLSPPASLLCTGDDSSGQSSWQTEGLPVSLAGHDSWAQVGMMDPEDIKSLDSNEGVALALAEERSENNSSNSDIVHVEREEAELLEEGTEGGAIDESIMSILGTESELAELREEFRDQTPPVPASSEPDYTIPASFISLVEAVVIDTPVSLSEEPSLRSEPEFPPPVSEPEFPPPVSEPSAPPTSSHPEPAAPSPVPAVEPDPEPEPAAATAPLPVEVAPPSPAKETPTPLLTAPAEPETISEPEQELEPVTVPLQSEEPKPEPMTVIEPEAPLAAPTAPEANVESPAEEAPAQAPVKMEPEPEMPLLLYGSALVAFAAILAYGVMRYRRK